jgi:predicted nucleotidyltransferase
MPALTTKRTRKMQRIPMRSIRALANQIGQAFTPDQVVLFGSYAYGKPRPESDVDLLVIMDSDLRNIDQALLITKKINYRFGVDLIVRTPRQVKERIDMGDFFMRDIVEKGKVLYARPDA